MDEILMRFGELALQRGWINAADLDRALAVQENSGERIGTLLVRMGALSRKQRLVVLGQLSGLRCIDRLPPSYKPLPGPFGTRTRVYLSSEGTWRIRLRRRCHLIRAVTRKGMIPITRVCLALPDPFDVETIRILRIWKPKAHLFFYDFPPQASAIGDATPWEQAGGGLSSPVVDWLDEALSEGARLGASDLHLVRESGVMTLRYRLHGRFHLGPEVPGAYQDALVPRIKVMAGLDVAEERLPQDGSFERRSSGQRRDFRVSILPGVEGEGAVLRILGTGTRSDAEHSLDDLLMPPNLLSDLRDWAHRRAGIILITGPTGSGKTTTLYALLRELDRSSLKIITLEDPVEYALEGAHQIQVNPEIGLTFAQGLRAILRHDPDVILVGEIRDKETAEIALRASLTGHLVLSTLHTNSAVGAFTRLHDMGIPQYLTADAVLGVLGQRLLGRICRACGGADNVCPVCHGTGIDGRVPIFEGGPAEPLRHLVRAQASEDELAARLRKSGYSSLAEDARSKAASGLVPLSELRAAGLWEPQ